MVFSEFLEACKGCSQGEESSEVSGVASVSDTQAPVAEHPGDGSLDDPSVLAELLAWLWR